MVTSHLTALALALITCIHCALTAPSARADNTANSDVTKLSGNSNTLNQEDSYKALFRDQTDGLFKRVVSDAAFYGARGKKEFGPNTFYGSRGKKNGMSNAFYGSRGKKDGLSRSFYGSRGKKVASGEVSEKGVERWNNAAAGQDVVNGGDIVVKQQQLQEEQQEPRQQDKQPLASANPTRTKRATPPYKRGGFSFPSFFYSSGKRVDGSAFFAARGKRTDVLTSPSNRRYDSDVRNRQRDTYERDAQWGSDRKYAYPRPVGSDYEFDDALSADSDVMLDFLYDSDNDAVDVRFLKMTLLRLAEILGEQAEHSDSPLNAVYGSKAKRGPHSGFHAIRGR